MRIVIQRVARASVTIDSAETRSIGQGLLLLVGFRSGDGEEEVRLLAKKAIEMRIFSDEDDAMNLSLSDVGGSVMAVSNFTLYADCKKGRRPSFVNAARPEEAIPLYEQFLELLRESGLPVVAGEFGADMQIDFVNDGPVTILLDSDEIRKK